jgi:Zn-dependent protease with chaperone function
MTIGELMAQVAVAGAVAAGMVEAMVRLWRVRDPAQALQLRRLALVLPLLLPGAKGLGAALGLSLGLPALFEVRPWLSLDLPGLGRAWAVAAALGLVTTALFIIQELLPALRARGCDREDAPVGAGEEGAALQTAARKVREAFGDCMPAVGLAAEGGLVACVGGGRRAGLLVSRELVRLLGPEELAAVLAHEAAHALRGDLRAAWPWFIVRALQCFSPAALLMFRWTLADQERAGDRLAAARGGGPGPLASALRKVSAASHRPGPYGARRRLLLRAGMAWEEDLVHRRLADLESAPAAPARWWGWRMGAAAAAVSGILAFVR